VRQNAVEVLRTLEPLTQDKMKITIAAEIHESLKGQSLQPVDMKICAAIGVVPYLKRRRVAAFFADQVAKLQRISPDWDNYTSHAEPLNLIDDYGGLAVIPPDQLASIVLWLVRCYLGEKGRRGAYGRNHDVFNSDVAAPIIDRLFKAAGKKARAALEAAAEDKRVQASIEYKPIAWRLEHLRDLTEE
jgi:hypothetical protein